MAVSVFASFSPREKLEAEFLKLLGGMITATRAEPECRRFDFYKSVGESRGYHLFEVYEDEAALGAHRETEHYKDYRARVADMLSEPVGVIVLDPIDAVG